MSPEFYTIVGVAIGLAALILNAQRSIGELRRELVGLGNEMHREFTAVRKEVGALAERVTRLEATVAHLEGAVAQMEKRLLRLENVVSDSGETLLTKGA